MTNSRRPIFAFAPGQRRAMLVYVPRVTKLLSAASALAFLGSGACSGDSTQPKVKAPVSTNSHSTAHSNRLAREKSPYLLQHQHNPVDWYAWGAEAFAKARQEQKPL